jgi:hypothetical protein
MERGLKVSRVKEVLGMLRKLFGIRKDEEANSLIQAEGELGQTEKAEAESEAALPQKNFEALEQKAEAEIEPSGQKVENVDEVAEAEKIEIPVFPCDVKINPYGFIHMPKRLLQELGWETTSKNSRVIVHLKAYKTERGVELVRVGSEPYKE